MGVNESYQFYNFKPQFLFDVADRIGSTGCGFGSGSCELLVVDPNDSDVCFVLHAESVLCVHITQH
jgi:hypothetical protein